MKGKAADKHQSDRRDPGSAPPLFNPGELDSQTVGAKDTGRVFNIQKFSLHDGPGIRDLVFLKGCPLRCQWCSNPESQLPHPEIFYRVDRCLGFRACGLCAQLCPVTAIERAEDGKARIDWSVCNHCGRCAELCPSGAMELVGRQMTIAEILAVVEKDTGFHARSGGGVTVSGGDPLVQADFVEHLLETCSDRGIDTAVETAGYGRWEQMEKIGRYANLILYDIKSMDAARHKACTGVSNTTIKDNLLRLSARFPDTPIIVRTPIIPGFNDSEKDILDIASFIKRAGTVREYRLVPFHRFGTPKYACLGRCCIFADVGPLSEARIRRLSRVAESAVCV